MTPISQPIADEAVDYGLEADLNRPWQVIVWDDPVNLMSYVVYVFQTHFKYDLETATRLMLQVHNEGRAVVANGDREAMETHVLAMQGYGLWASMEQ